MINFEHKLPSMNIDGRNNGTYNNEELGIPGILTTKDSELGRFIHTLKCNLFGGRRHVFVDGKVLLCNINWIRDHVHILKGTKYFEHDLLSFYDFIIDTQRSDGQFYELIKQLDDEHWKKVNEDCYIKYPEDNVALVRLELEADIEYLMVEGAKQLYGVFGDDAWLRRVLPKLELGIDYITSSEKRWDKELGLVKRPFTIDTWDFTPEPRSHNDRRIHSDEKMSVMHGDNSGVFAAMHTLAWFNDRLGNEEKANEWRERARQLRENMFRHLWRGKFFTHQLHINHAGLDDKEDERLSLSLTYDINRGVTNLEESRSIIEEFMRRRQTTKNFAEWFSIDPSYEQFNRFKHGEYVNGSVSPFTAGELAKAAFNNGYEEYGWDIISRFMKLVERDKTVYFVYYPDSTPQPQGGPSMWGAAALLSAVDEGLAGIINTDVGYKKIRFAPKFPVTHYDELRYITGCEKIGVVVDVRYILTDVGMRYTVTSPAEEIDAHVLIPRNNTCKSLYINGMPSSFTTEKVGDSVYINFGTKASGKVDFEIYFS